VAISRYRVGKMTTLDEKNLFLRYLHTFGCYLLVGCTRRLPRRFAPRNDIYGTLVSKLNNHLEFRGMGVFGVLATIMHVYFYGIHKEREDCKLNFVSFCAVCRFLKLSIIIIKQLYKTAKMIYDTIIERRKEGEWLWNGCGICLQIQS